MSVNTFRATVVAAAVLTAPAAAASPKRTTNGKHPEAVEQIVAANDKWDKDIVDRNLDGLVDAYADDAQEFPAGRPAVAGKKALRAYWGELLQLPGFVFDTTDAHVAVADSADMAWVSGTYLLSFKEKDAEVKDRGKYVLVYTKVGGKWKLALVVSNSDGGN